MTRDRALSTAKTGEKCTIQTWKAFRRRGGGVATGARRGCLACFMVSRVLFTRIRTAWRRHVAPMRLSLATKTDPLTHSFASNCCSGSRVDSHLCTARKAEELFPVQKRPPMLIMSLTQCCRRLTNRFHIVIVTRCTLRRELPKNLIGVVLKSGSEREVEYCF